MQGESKMYRGLTKDSKSKTDFQDVTPSMTFDDFAKKKNHADFFCSLHMKDRLLNYCYLDNLVDVVFSGIVSLKFSKLDFEYPPCKVKDCMSHAEYRIDRID